MFQQMFQDGSIGDVDSTPLVLGVDLLRASSDSESAVIPMKSTPGLNLRVHNMNS